MGLFSGKNSDDFLAQQRKEESRYSDFERHSRNTTSSYTETPKANNSAEAQKKVPQDSRSTYSYNSNDTEDYEYWKHKRDYMTPLGFEQGELNKAGVGLAGILMAFSLFSGVGMFGLLGLIILIVILIIKHKKRK